jgi:DNA topoisomerase-1
MTQLEALQQTGIRRVGSPKAGFRFMGAHKADLDRIHELKLPPAWTDVYVNRDAKARLQAIGRDKAGRWQYRYNDEAVEERERKKYERLMAFARAMPSLRSEIDHGLALKGLPREKVMACILRILSTCFMRAGSETYAEENGSFGITTLQNRHAQVHGDTVTFDFMGKSKKRQVRDLHDRRVARTIRELKKLPGKELFQWVADDGAIVKVTRQSLNEYIKDVMGERFSAKDFRTWAGTMICANVLARLHDEIVEGHTDKRRLMTAAVKETAEQLGNTPAVCKSSYIWPSILTSFYKGDVVKPYFRTLDDLLTASPGRAARCEQGLVSLLRQGRNAVPVALAKKMNRRKRELNKAAQRLSRKMRTPRMRKLARAFTVH